MQARPGAGSVAAAVLRQLTTPPSLQQAAVTILLSAVFLQAPRMDPLNAQHEWDLMCVRRGLAPVGGPQRGLRTKSCTPERLHTS